MFIMAALWLYSQRKCVEVIGGSGAGGRWSGVLQMYIAPDSQPPKTKEGHAAKCLSIVSLPRDL